MSFTDVRVQVPPRAPRDSRKTVSFFVQSILVKTGEVGWILLFLASDGDFVYFCLIESAAAYFHVMLSILTAIRRHIREPFVP